MKNKVFIGLVFALSLIFVLQLAVFADEAVGVTTWTEGSTTRQAVVSTKYEAVNVTKVVDYVMLHIQGLSTPFSPGSHTVSSQMGPSFPEAYAEKLTSAAAKVGLPVSFNESVKFTNTYYIPTTNATGAYSPTTTVTGYSGEYRVEVVGATSTNVITSGVINFAPVSCTGLYTGVRRVAQ